MTLKKKRGVKGLRGQSILGLVLLITPSKVPAQASLFVKKSFKLKIFLTVAGIDECSYSDVGDGPVGPCNTAFHPITTTK